MKRYEREENEEDEEGVKLLANLANPQVKKRKYARELFSELRDFIVENRSYEFDPNEKVFLDDLKMDFRSFCARFTSSRRHQVFEEKYFNLMLKKNNLTLEQNGDYIRVIGLRRNNLGEQEHSLQANVLQTQDDQIADLTNKNNKTIVKSMEKHVVDNFTSPQVTHQEEVKNDTYQDTGKQKNDTYQDTGKQEVTHHQEEVKNDTYHQDTGKQEVTHHQEEVKNDRYHQDTGKQETVVVDNSTSQQVTQKEECVLVKKQIISFIQTQFPLQKQKIASQQTEIDSLKKRHNQLFTRNNEITQKLTEQINKNALLSSENIKMSLKIIELCKLNDELTNELDKLKISILEPK
jgi:hypothetical protein